MPNANIAERARIGHSIHVVRIAEPSRYRQAVDVPYRHGNRFAAVRQEKNNVYLGNFQ
jgi:hypothetical protein